MDYFQPPSDANVGMKLKTEFVFLTTHGAVTAGNVYSVDIDTATAANDGVATTSKAGLDGAVEGSIWLVAAEDAASGARCKFYTQGYVRVLAGSGGLTANGAGSCDASAGLINASANDIVIALLPEAISATEYGYVWFKGDGWYVKGD